MLGSIDAKYKVAALASGRGKLKSYIVEKIDDMKLIQDTLWKYQNIGSIDIICIEVLL